jgi:hypothetical protein
MKTYFPYIYKKIGVTFVLLAIILSITANINDVVQGLLDAMYTNEYNPQSTFNESEFKIIPTVLCRVLVWISLFFSFSGFLLYMFSSEKVEDEYIEQLRFKCLAKSLLYTWAIAAILIIINGDFQLQGLYILQFQLFAYVVIYNYHKK